MKKLLAILSLALFLMACGDGLDREALREKVMAVHDEVMPKWGRLKLMKKQILDKAAELEAADSTDSKIAELRDIAIDLDAAHEVMSTWMRDWQKNAKTYESGEAGKEETLAFFKSEQERVDKMKEQILKASAAAEAALL
ncbi:MAG: hypothetical protein HEP71_09570 [Roseivirga sp.]|nr:hypothetical protein [Roseivirga sp.]